MTTQEVANRLVELCREGKYQQAIEELYAPNIVSVEAEGIPERTVKGLEAIAAKGEKFQSMLEAMHSTTVTDPIVAGNHFSCGMLMNVTMKGAPGPIDMNEICVYTVEDGKVVREEFFYEVQPQEA